MHPHLFIYFVVVRIRFLSLHCCLTSSVNRRQESQKDRPCIGRKSFLYSDPECIKVKMAPCVSYCSHTGLSFYTYTQGQTAIDSQLRQLMLYDKVMVFFVLESLDLYVNFFLTVSSPLYLVLTLHRQLHQCVPSGD